LSTINWVLTEESGISSSLDDFGEADTLKFLEKAMITTYNSTNFEYNILLIRSF